MITVKDLKLSDFQVKFVRDYLCEISEDKVFFKSNSEVCPYDGSSDGGRSLLTALVLEHPEVNIEFLYREKFYAGLEAIATFNGEYRKLDLEEDLPEWFEQLDD